MQSTHIGGKRDQEIITSEVMAEISEAVKFSKDMVISGMSKHAFLAPSVRLNLSKNATISLGTVPPLPPVLADSGSTSGPDTSASSGPVTPAKESARTNSDHEETSPGSPGIKKVLGRMGKGKSPASMLSHHQRKQTFQGPGPDSNKALLTAYETSQEKPAQRATGA